MLLVLLVPLTVVFVACAHEAPMMNEHGSHRSFDDADAWARYFEDPKRDEWQRPDDVIKRLGLAPDAKVADIGAATGYFPVRVAHAVPQGHVYGVDIESSMTEFLAKRAEREGLSNLTAILGAPDDPKLPEPVDLVMVVDTYHHIGSRLAYFKKLTEKVKPSGRLVIIDFTKRSSMGPPSSAKVDSDQVIEELRAAGWVFSASHDVLPEQYFLVFGRS